MTHSRIQEPRTALVSLPDAQLLPLLAQATTIAQHVSALSHLLCRRLQSGTDSIGLPVLATAVQSEINDLLCVLRSAAVVIPAPDHEAPRRQTLSLTKTGPDQERTHAVYHSGRAGGTR